MVGLGIPPDFLESAANGVSADGRVVVGAVGSEELLEAFVWTPESGFVLLGLLENGTRSNAQAISADGHTVVGSAENFPWDDLMRWTFDGSDFTATDLGLRPAGGFAKAFGVTPDGAVIVGAADGTTYDWAVIWDAETGIRDLRKLLLDEYNLGGVLFRWRLVESNAVSADGKIIAGLAANPDQNHEAFLADMHRN